MHISEEAVKALLEGFFPEGYKVRQVSLWEEKKLLIIRMSFPKLDAPVNTEYFERLARDVRNYLMPLGFENVEVEWVADEEESFVECGWRKHFRKPMAWGLSVAALYILLKLGGAGVFWAIVLGFLGYGVAWLLLTPQGMKSLEKILKQFKE